MPPELRSRVWIVSETYAPELTSTGYYMTALAEGLAARFSVSVLCGQPTYSSRGTVGARREQLNGVDVHRVHGFTFDKNQLFLRILNMLSLTVTVFVALVWDLRRRDVVIVVTNPPTLAYLTRVASWLRGARCVVLVHDVYPEAMIAAGLMRSGSAAARVLNIASAWLLRHADAVVAIGRDMADVLLRKTGGRARVERIPVWASEDLFASTDEAGVRAFRASLGLGDACVAQYAGNIGRVQDIELLLGAARIWLSDAPHIRLVVIGAGARRAWLKDQLTVRGLTNVLLLDERPRAGQAEYLRACDVAVIALVPGMRGIGVPSRLYNIFATSRPVVAAVDADSEPGMAIAEERAGWVVPAGDVAAFAAAVMAACADAHEAGQRGRNGRRAAEEKYTRDTIVRMYEGLVEELA
jgi:colanic acid biosynthesis glycosyl transferase WcaI